MIGTLDPDKRQVTVIGAGIGGLLAAYDCLKKGYEVEVLESSSRVGGLIETISTPWGPVEKAAHSLLVSPPVEQLFRELHLPLLDVERDSKARYIVRNQKMSRMPLGPLELARTLTQALTKPPVISKESLESLTLEEWGRRYLGLSATQYLLSPFVTGVFACQPKELLAKAAFPKLLPTQPEQSLVQHFRANKRAQAGSSVPSRAPSRARPKMQVLKSGMQSLVDALAQKLEGKIKLQHPVDSLAPFLENSNLIVTTPAPITARLLENLDPKSAAALGKIRYSPLVTITSFYESSAFSTRPPRGVGVLIPRGEGYRILGCLFNSSAFSERALKPNTVSVTTMVGGTTDPEAIVLSDSDLHALLKEEHGKLLGAHAPAQAHFITRWRHAIPIYNQTIPNSRHALSTGFCSTPGRLVFGNYAGQVSIRGMIESLCQTPDV
jgi:oxygen-dependent protoporphyrinogen oxidase